ncbi:MAG: helix-turn-helix transcriptional regulator [Magnetococcales bacterium]|nr:helix-turn-helix transcriptional regulator [Magnetococcales bacterium]
MRLSGGGGSVTEGANIVDRMAFREDWLRGQGFELHKLALFMIEGDSMEPDLRPGDMVLIDLRTQGRVDFDAIYAIRVGGLLRIKRLQWNRNKSITVRSANQYYKDETIQPGEEEDFQIIGRAVWVGRRI